MDVPTHPRADVNGREQLFLHAARMLPQVKEGRQDAKGLALKLKRAEPFPATNSLPRVVAVAHTLAPAIFPQHLSHSRTTLLPTPLAWS